MMGTFRSRKANRVTRPPMSAPFGRSSEKLWTTLAAQYAETRKISAGLSQALLMFIARRALAKPRTYLPSFQWETLYGRLPWRLVKEELALGIINLSETAADADRPHENADHGDEDVISEDDGVSVDVQRFADAVKQIFDELRGALEGPSGLEKLAGNKSGEFQIRAWLKKTIDRKLRDVWEKNCPEGHKFYDTAIGVLKEHFFLIHSKFRAKEGMSRGFYCVQQNWWGVRDWLRTLPKPCSEYEILERLEKVGVVAPYSMSLSLQEKHVLIKKFFDTCFEAVGGPLPEQLLIGECKKFFGVTDTDLPFSFDVQATERDELSERPFSERVEDKSSQTAFRRIALEPAIQGFVQEMSSRERRMATRLYEELDGKAGRLPVVAETRPGDQKAEEPVANSTYYWNRKKIFKAFEAGGLENFDLILNLFEQNLDSLVEKKKGLDL
jgi:hypothetical protein